MKKFFYAVICLLLPAVASAQMIVGGTIDFSANTSKNSSYYEGNESLGKSPTRFSFGIAPKVGYVIENKWEVGAKLNLHSNQKTTYVSLVDKEGNVVIGFYAKSREGYPCFCSIALGR